MMCIENVKDAKTKEIFDAEVKIGDRIAAHCQRLGLIVRPVAHLNILSPPLILDHANVDEVVGILRKGIENTMSDLVSEGIWNG